MDEDVVPRMVTSVCEMTNSASTRNVLRVSVSGRRAKDSGSCWAGATCWACALEAADTVARAARAMLSRVMRFMELTSIDDGQGASLRPTRADHRRARGDGYPLGTNAQKYRHLRGVEVAPREARVAPPGANHR